MPYKILYRIIYCIRTLNKEAALRIMLVRKLQEIKVWRHVSKNCNQSNCTKRSDINKQKIANNDNNSLYGVHDVGDDKVIIINFVVCSSNNSVIVICGEAILYFETIRRY